MIPLTIVHKPNLIIVFLCIRRVEIFHKLEYYIDSLNNSKHREVGFILLITFSIQTKIIVNTL